MYLLISILILGAGIIIGLAIDPGEREPFFKYLGNAGSLIGGMSALAAVLIAISQLKKWKLQARFERMFNALVDACIYLEEFKDSHNEWRDTVNYIWDMDSIDALLKKVTTKDPSNYAKSMLNYYLLSEEQVKTDIGKFKKSCRKVDYLFKKSNAYPEVTFITQARDLKHNWMKQKILLLDKALRESDRFKEKLQAATDEVTNSIQSLEEHLTALDHELHQ